MVFYWANIKSENESVIAKHKILIHDKYFIISSTLEEGIVQLFSICIHFYKCVASGIFCRGGGGSIL